MYVTNNQRFIELGFTKYEINCYIALIKNNPINGSILSRASGVSRSKVYEVLRNMIDKGFVIKIENGLYVPLPPEELIKRLRNRFKNNIEYFKNHLAKPKSANEYEFVWSIKGYAEVIAKAIELIESAKKELYIRLSPIDGKLLDDALRRAEDRGVVIKYIHLGQPHSNFSIQVVHPKIEKMLKISGERPFDIVMDRWEALVGRFENDNEDNCPINWSKNHWFVISSRDNIRHDFFHYFFHKTYDLGKKLTKEEETIVQLIQDDNSWVGTSPKNNG
jgi:HTH-type transcriptional regulator, sugar sensing transcriptional regulator